MDTNLRARQMERLREDPGFFAALDQSGGSTPSALRQYGIDPTAYANEDEMFKLVQQMRERIVTAPSFDGMKILAAILFEKTMTSQVQGQLMPSYLWEQRGILSFLKIDRGLAKQSDGIQLMNPIPDLAALLRRGVEAGVVGTKMRSVIHCQNPHAITRIVEQQFQLAQEIGAAGLLPIVEPEVSTKLPDHDRMAAERLLLQTLTKALDELPREMRLILKLSIPVEANLYEPLMEHLCVVRVLALSGGFSRVDACRRLKDDRGMIASFSRAFLEGLKFQMSDADFNQSLAEAINEIFFASVHKS